MLPNTDFLFVIACLTLGFGISLASYRTFAARYDWPMGEVHANGSRIPIVLGGFAAVIALLFASARQYYIASNDFSSYFDGLWIVFGGIVWGIFWTSTMRVGSQISLILAPLATVILTVSWAHVRTSPGYIAGNRFVPYTYAERVPLPKRTPRHDGTKVWLAHGLLAHPAK